MSRKITADFVFLPDEERRTFTPCRDILLEVGEQGEILDISKVSMDNTEGVEYFKGAIAPGFVNSHCHLELSHLKGRFSQGSGMSGFINQINSMRESVGLSERLEAIERESDNLYREGVVAVADISNCAETFKLKSNSKIYYRTFVELFGTEASDAEKVLESGRELVAEGKRLGIDLSVTPHSCYTMSPLLLELSAHEGLRSGFLSYHSQESPQEEELIMYGRGALADNYRGRGLSLPPVTGTTALEYFVERLRERLPLGKKKAEGRINIVHNVVISQRSIDCTKEYLAEPYFTICPLSNLFIHKVLPPLGLMIENDLKIAIGTDSLSSNLQLSMIEEFKCLQTNFAGLNLGQILYFASYNGARVVGKEEKLGSIEIGKCPGLVHITQTDGVVLSDSSTSRLIEI